MYAKSLQSCPTLCNPIDGGPPGSPIHGILQARTLEWVAISFSNHICIYIHICINLSVYIYVSSPSFLISVSLVSQLALKESSYLITLHFPLSITCTLLFRNKSHKSLGKPCCLVAKSCRDSFATLWTVAC